MTTDRRRLADRVRRLLAAEPSTREVSMFGGLSFLVDGSIVVAVRGEGDLLARVDPAQGPELAALPGARPAEMGAGRAMGPGWIHVDAAVLDDEHVTFWVLTALDRTGRR